jgi:DNA-binding NtrC family response regulator
MIEDEPVVRSALRAQLSSQGHTVDEAERLAAARDLLPHAPPDVVLLDVQLPDGDGIDFLLEIRREWPDTPVIVMTGHGSIESAVEAMRRGAVNFIQKPIHLDELTVSLDQAVETGRLRIRASEEFQRSASRYQFSDVIAQSPAMSRVLDQARVVVSEALATTILLLGETGTGKGLLAGAIHYASTRAHQPFQKVICSAIPESLLEAELFGHERGAFTDAKERRRGVFEAADGGTVFLDEIGDMPAPLQAKLLGILEDRSFRRIGGGDLVEVDVRVIAATHRNLERAVEEGTFRQDLYYRLNVVPLTIPPLRDRPEDILPLARAFLDEFNRSLGRHVSGLAPDAEERLMQYSWPGNVRELRNVLERALLFASCSVLSASDLFLDVGRRPSRASETSHADRSLMLPRDGLNLEQHEMELVRQAMQRTENNQSRAAALLGISRDQIRYRLDKMGALRSSTRRRRTPN